MASWLALVNVLVARVAPCPLRKNCADNPAPPAARRVSDVIPPPPPPPPPPPAKPPSSGQTQLEPEQDPVDEFEVVDAVANYMPLFLPPDQLTSSARGRSVRHSDPKCPMALSILPRNRKVLSQQEASASGLFLCSACKGRRGLIQQSRRFANQERDDGAKADEFVKAFFAVMDKLPEPDPSFVL